jgi:hypothetical protein
MAGRALMVFAHITRFPLPAAMYWALGVVVLSAVWYAVMQVWKPDRIRNAAAHAAEHHGVAPLDENVDFTPAPPDTAI